MLTAFLGAMPPRADRFASAGRFAAIVSPMLWLFLLVPWLTACAPPRQVRPPSELLAVAVGPEDNLDDLARRYLGAADRRWIIQDFNGIDSPAPGQLLLIPRRNYRPGGLAPGGYQTVPVLAYPDLSTVKSEQASLIADRFRGQIQYLKAEGYHVVDIHQMAAFMAFDATLPPKAVVLTFDDQSRLFYDLIFPILRTHQFPGTLFITPGAVGAESMATWTQLNEMMEAGIRIQYRLPPALAQGLKPTRFPNQTELAQMVSRLARDRQDIETQGGQPCHYLAYVGDDMAALKIMLAEKAGFKGGFNLAGDSNPFYRNLFAVQRVPVSWDELPERFAKHLQVFKDEVLR